MPFPSSDFVAWQEAERHALAAENKLFAKVLSPDPRDAPTREEVAEVRALRHAANAGMKQMLADMRRRAAALRPARSGPGGPVVQSANS